MCGKQWVLLFAALLATSAGSNGETPRESSPQHSGVASRDSVGGRALADKLTELSQADAARHVFVQFSELPAANQRVEVERDGLRLLNYVGNRTYIATADPERLKPDALTLTGLLEDVRPIERIHRAHPQLLRGEVPEWAWVGQTSDGDRIVALNVLVHRDVPREPAIERWTRQFNAVLVAELRTINGCVLETPLRSVQLLADDDAVLWIEPPLPLFGPNNDSNRQVSEAAAVNAAPYGLDGTGINVLVYDAGTARETHLDFGGRLYRRDTTPRNEHSTHVAGTIGGSGVASGGVYAGMAPGVTMQSYGCEFTTPDSFFYMNPGDIEADYDQAINVYGVHISNNSIGSNVAKYGFPCEWEGNYGVTSALIDAIVCGGLGSPFRVVWSLGNERAYEVCGTEYYTIAPPAGAKNHISVGAVDSDDEAMTYFSSWGPTDDGRLKPDLVGPGCESNPSTGYQCGAMNPETDPGCGVRSCGSTNNSAYKVLCGTSMATPTVTGGLALLLQDYGIQYPERSWPRNSTLKIFLAHTAADLGNPGPDYQHGYGAVRIRQAIDFMRLDRFIERQVDQGEIYTLYAIVDSGADQLKITLAWDDPPALPSVYPNLINDLDLRVYGPTDEMHYPWTLNPNDPQANATRTQADRVNNIEQVVVDSPSPGYWRVEVRGYSVTEGPQVFSLCSSHPIQPYFVTQAISRSWTLCNSVSGDLDCDCIVDLDDLAQLLGHWGGTDKAFFQGDSDLDGDVDLSDLAEMLMHYQQSCE